MELSTGEPRKPLDTGLASPRVPRVAQWRRFESRRGHPGSAGCRRRPRGPARSKARSSDLGGGAGKGRTGWRGWGGPGLALRPEHREPEAPCDCDSAETKGGSAAPSAQAGTLGLHSYPLRPQATPADGPWALDLREARDPRGNREGMAEDTGMRVRGWERSWSGPAHPALKVAAVIAALANDPVWAWISVTEEDNRSHPVIPGSGRLSEAFLLKRPLVLMCSTLAPLTQISTFKSQQGGSFPPGRQEEDQDGAAGTGCGEGEPYHTRMWGADEQLGAVAEAGG